MATKLNRAKQAIRSWSSEHKKLRGHVKAVREFWKLYNRNRIDGDEFANLVATEFQFENTARDPAEATKTPGAVMYMPIIK